jgi:hypothetical protein
VRVPPRYQIRLTGPARPDLPELFTGLDVRPDGSCTVISGDLDQAALHGVLERLRTLDIELIEVRRDTSRTS